MSGEGELNAEAPGAGEQDGGAASVAETLQQVTAMLRNVADKNKELEDRIQLTTTTINETRAQTTASATEMAALNRAMQQMTTAFSAVSETIKRNAELARQAADQASEARRLAEEAQQTGSSTRGAEPRRPPVQPATVPGRGT